MEISFTVCVNAIAKKSYCIRGEIVPFAAHMDTELYEKSVYNSVYD